MTQRRWNRELAALMVSAATLFAAGGASAQYVVDVYKPDKVYPGTTIFGDESDLRRPRIVEVDMNGKVVWSYDIPSSLGRGRATDVEWIPASDHILFTRESGVYEVDRKGNIVWSCPGPSSHDADRLANGNTLVAYAWGSDSSSPEAREVDPKCNVVWEWHAAEHLQREKRILDKEGYTHTNSVIRLANGNTLVSLRNFYMLVEVAPSGQVVWKLPGLFTTPHDPEILPNGNILVNTRAPQVIKELTPGGRIVWSYVPDQKDVQTVRYNHRLPNGNILFIERVRIIEITRQKEIVWQLRLPDVPTGGDFRNRWLYKGERIPAGKRAAAPYAYAAPSETLARSGEAATSIEQQLQQQAQRIAHAMMMRMDADGDGRISRNEFRGRAPFENIDTDGDGFINVEEAQDFHTKRLTRQAGGAQGPGDDGRAPGAAERGGKRSR